MYVIQWRTHALRLYQEFSRDQQEHTSDALEILAEDPFRASNVKRLRGTNVPIYRLRVGRFRVLYFVIREEHAIEIVDVFFRQGDADYRQRL